MKFLRFIFILVVVVLVGYLLLCVMSAKEMKIEVSTTINAPKAQVWEQVVKFRNWPNWSPWQEVDPTIVVDYTGTDGEPGSTQHYVGQKAGEGLTTNAGLSEDEMKYAMDFKKPIEGKADGYYKVVADGAQTKVTWYFHEDYSFMMRGGAAIMGAQKMMNTTFARGLELLKNYCEAHATAAPAGNMAAITEVQYPAHIYAGIRKVVKWSDMHQFFSDSYGLLGKEAGARIIGPSASLYYAWDTTKMQGDIVACFPVADDAPVKGASIIKVPASLAYKMVYVGPYGGFESAHKALMQHVKETGKTETLAVEEYIKTPANETDSNKYETNILYLVQ